jgi:hypothetical protein
MKLEHANLRLILLTVALLLTGTAVAAETCGVKVLTSGTSVAGTKDAKGARQVPYISRELFGNVSMSLETRFLSPDGFAVSVNLHSSGNYRFAYSGNIPKIRIRKGATLVYEGAPIEFYQAAKNQNLKVELLSRGEASVTISDDCVNPI